MRSRHTLGLIMAAGRSRRFGSDKRLARLPDGRTILTTTLAAARDAFEQVRVVVNAQVAPADLGIPESLALVIRPEAPEGLGGSIADAFRVLDEPLSCCDIDSVAIWLGDMPWVRPKTCQRLARRATADTVVRPLYHDMPGHPVFFGRDFWSALAANSDEWGARPVLERFADKVTVVPVTDSGVVRDIDYPDAILRPEP